VVRKEIVLVASLFFLSIVDVFSAEAKMLQVEVIETTSQANHRTIELSGTIVALQDAQLAPLESGVVEEILVDEGDHVRKGQALLVLDDTLAKLQLTRVHAELKAAEVQLMEAKRQFDEVSSLAKTKVVADTLLAERKAMFAKAEADFSKAKAVVGVQQELVERHTLRAPFDGVIADRKVDVGEWVQPQSQVFQLVSDQALRMLARLPQEHLNLLKKEGEVRVTVVPDALKNLEMTLTLTKLVTVIEPASRTVQIRIDLPESPDLFPGMSARVRFDLSGSSEGFTWIPRSAIKQHPDGGKSVFIAEEGRARRFQVNVMKTRVDQVGVTGLPKDPTVVVTGVEILRDNQAIEPIKAGGR